MPIIALCKKYCRLSLAEQCCHIKTPGPRLQQRRVQSTFTGRGWGAAALGLSGAGQPFPGGWAHLLRLNVLLQALTFQKRGAQLRLFLPGKPDRPLRSWPYAAAQQGKVTLGHLRCVYY